MLCLLVIVWIFRWQVVQAVNISSSSMEPTLYGGNGKDDMVILNKLAYKLGEPERWDVIVFKRLADRGSGTRKEENYIKRLVGLPGEKIRIKNGDIFIDGAMVAKPESLQRNLWLPVYGGDDDEPVKEPLADAWNPTAEGASLYAGALEARSSVDLLLNGVRYRFDIMDGAADRCSDLRLAFDVIPHTADTRVSGTIEDNTTLYRFSIGTKAGDGAALFEGRKRVAHDKDAVLTIGKRARIVFRKVDGMVSLRIDGETVLENKRTPRVADVRTTRSSSVRFGVRRGRARFESVRLARDVYYTAPAGADFGVRQAYRIPPGQYFFLGDNSTNSQDSRAWGCVKRRDMVGKAVFVFNRFKTL